MRSAGRKGRSIRTRRPTDEHANEVVSSFGKRTRELRKKAGLSQEELALRAGLDRSYVGQVERGECNVTVLNIYKLATGLKVEPSDLLSPPEKPSQ